MARFGGGGAGGPGPRGALTGIGGFLLLGGGIWFFNNALFNGMRIYNLRSRLGHR
jgi:prohibitin 2